jgi:hypothetical protein
VGSTLDDVELKVSTPTLIEFKKLYIETRSGNKT